VGDGIHDPRLRVALAKTRVMAICSGARSSNAGSAACSSPILEPFAKSLWKNGIENFASSAVDFVWSKQTYFGGLYQKPIARRR